MWRGPVAAAVDRFCLTLGAADLPDVDDTTERMEVRVCPYPLVSFLVWMGRRVAPGFGDTTERMEAGAGAGGRLRCLAPPQVSCREALPSVADLPLLSLPMQVEVRGLSARLLSGDYRLEAGPLRAAVHRSGGVQQLGGTLLELPFLEAPGVRLR